MRIDVWLWRARFFKTRGLAAAKAGEGRIRITRGAASGRIDKAARTVKVGDQIAFAIGTRAFAVRILALGVRRGPPGEARGLYAPIEGTAGIDIAPEGLTNTAPIARRLPAESPE